MYEPVFVLCTAGSACLPPVLHFRTIYDLSVFVLDIPGNAITVSCGKSSDVRQLTGSMGRFTPPWFSPSRPSTEVSLCCDALWPYPRCSPGLTGRLSLGSWIVFAFTADVALHHSFVSDECIFCFQGASDVLAVSASAHVVHCMMWQ